MTAAAFKCFYEIREQIAPIIWNINWIWKRVVLPRGLFLINLLHSCYARIFGDFVLPAGHVPGVTGIFVM
jgi:hypothetical protein